MIDNFDAFYERLVEQLAMASYRRTKAVGRDVSNSEYREEMRLLDAAGKPRFSAQMEN